MMSNFTNLLALSYFKQYGDSYVLSELTKILGISAEQLDTMISELIENGYIEYKCNMLSITIKGLSELIDSNMHGYNNQDTEFILLHVNKDKAWPLDKVYLPKNFGTKI